MKKMRHLYPNETHTYNNCSLSKSHHKTFSLPALSPKL